MKNIILITGFLLGIMSIQAQNNVMKVQGSNLVTTNGQTIVLRGINYPILNEGSISISNASQYQNYIDQVALTGANAIRIPWHTDGVHWRDMQPYGTPGTLEGYIDNGHLSNLIGYCRQKGMIPILEIHDVTCSDNWSALLTTVQNWWLKPEILNLIETHKEYLIINIANEMGKAEWTVNSTAAMNTFKNNYNQVIANLRNAGVKVPLMIDAPDCGTSSTQLLSVAQDMLNADSEGNLIFSAHTYWYGYANTTTAITTKINEIVNSGVCFVFGEIANRQDVTGDPVDGTYNIDNIYQEVLTQACTHGIGWLAWTFNHDWESNREISSTSQFSNLTTYGNDLVYNTVYGLLAGQCNAVPLSVSDFSALQNTVKIYPNPASEIVFLENTQNVIQITLYDSTGRMLKSKSDNFNQIDVSDLSTGIYYLKIEQKTGSQTEKIAIN